MKSKLLLALTLLAGSLAAQPRVSFGMSFGSGGYYPPPPPPRYAYAQPRCPGPGYVWVDGFWQPGRDRYYWQPGAWMRPPHPRSRWTAPRYNRGHWNSGYWR